MDCPSNILPNGTVIETHAVLEDASGLRVGYIYIQCRRPNEIGVISGVVGGHGGDVYWVKHGDVVAVYCWSDFELASQPASESYSTVRNLIDILESDEL